jgi:diguanylate cyclase (GGDEF)-like protein
MAGSWLCRDDVDRERLLDMERRLKPVRAITIGMLGVALIISAPWIGWWTLAPLALAAGLFKIADDMLDEAERPEYLMFAAWALSELTIAAAVAAAGSAAGPATMAWLAIPVVTLSARFSTRGVIAGVIWALALLAAVAFGAYADQIAATPPLVIAPAALILGIATLSTALMRSDVEHREEAVIDALTGMLNRHALENRVGELAQQSKLTGEPVGVIVGDLDYFKGINDTLGHQAGDTVLRTIAYELRKDLRAFDLAYRIGGDEFLILMPGAGLEECEDLAHQLCRTVQKSLGDSINLTISFGVSTSTPGETFDYEKVFAAADHALYAAKQDGRNQVRVAGQQAGLEPLEAAPEPFTAAFAD